MSSLYIGLGVHRAAGALMELNVDGMIEEAVPLNAPVQQDVQGMDVEEQMEVEMLGPFMDCIIEPLEVTRHS